MNNNKENISVNLGPPKRRLDLDTVEGLIHKKIKITEQTELQEYDILVVSGSDITKQIVTSLSGVNAEVVEVSGRTKGNYFVLSYYPTLIIL